MSRFVELNLALILFLPWFAILGALFWLYPRQPRNAARRLFDAVSLAASVCAFVLAIRWAHRYAGDAYRAMWPQIFATSLGYGVFLATLSIAGVVRWRWLRRLSDFLD
ncbi:hypothetical protein [Lysobacter antibioticus]|uniref:Putative transmembrane protein n=1 Tax=Lysobacter antibioticus TaxID=84531 RepID=A0A0S2F6L1_LYSAN|nr:hypothetical protein [Lysobacter antibioticus]ALN79162.1 putative transmembrane protein [Lysobacter antibioticus]